MANRSYLYAVDRVPDGNAPTPRIVGVSEWNWDVPVVHEVLLTGSPALCPSSIWGGEVQAIVGNYDEGVANLERVFARLPQTPEVQRDIAEARAFLLDPEVRSAYLLLEPAEIHDLAGDADGMQVEMGELYRNVRDADGLVEFAVQEFKEKPEEVTGRGSWRRTLYFQPVGSVEASAAAPQASPPTSVAPYPVLPPTGAMAWGLGLLVLIPIPFISAIVAGIAMIIAGLSQRQAGGIARENGRNAANWGVTFIVLTVLLVGGHFILLFILTGDGTKLTGFYPLGILLTVWAATVVTHIILSIAGIVRASRQQVLAPVALPFFAR